MKLPKLQWAVKLDRTYGRLTHHSGHNGRWYITGTVATRWGLVEVYCQEDHSHYRLIARGREHGFSEKRSRTKRGLAVVAAKLARSLAGGGR